tara:strand:- start:376 stop:567 length:192 start_codon:yes stop_codon:yes gene_type:complete
MKSKEDIQERIDTLIDRIENNDELLKDKISEGSAEVHVIFFVKEVNDKYEQEKNALLWVLNIT